MKDNTRIMYHPNQENKTGSAPYASSTQQNFSDNEPLLGKKVYMKIVKVKRSKVESIYIFLRGLIRNLISTSDNTK